ncbi:hypothetical protein ACFLRZ_05915, partial [Bacteroidota bacterium]
DDADTIQDINNYNIDHEFTTYGSGVNLKLGIIIRPANWFRIGGAVHSPTYYYKMHDDYSTSIHSYWDNDSPLSDRSYGEFDYKLVTPMRAIGSVAFIFGKVGLISADYEYVDYAEARLRADRMEDEDYFADINQKIQNSYLTANNIRFGTEWRFNPFTIRGGYAIYGSPFKPSLNDGEKTSISFGFGFRQKNYYVDLAFVMTTKEEDYYLYSSNLVNPAMNELTENSLLLTLGFKY